MIRAKNYGACSSDFERMRCSVHMLTMLCAQHVHVSFRDHSKFMSDELFLKEWGMEGEGVKTIEKCPRH